MTRFVLDTNVYISAERDERWADDLLRFYASALPSTYLHAVVAQELLVGALGPDRRQVVHANLVMPFQRRRRIVTPSFGAWIRSGEAVAELIASRAVSAGGFTRSFLNDVLLASSCREAGLTLVTRNLADFERIHRVLDFDYVPPWPT